MKWLLPLLFLLTPSALAQLPPMPPGAPGYVAPIRSPKHKAFIDSLGTPMAKAAAAPLAAPVPLIQLTLKWDWTNTYNPPDYATNIVFDVYSSVTLTNTVPLAHYDDIPVGFIWLGFTNWPNTSFPVVSNLPQSFFIVRAFDKGTGVHSKWNEK